MSDVQSLIVDYFIIILSIYYSNIYVFTAYKTGFTYPITRSSSQYF